MWMLKVQQIFVDPHALDLLTSTFDLIFLFLLVCEALFNRLRGRHLSAKEGASGSGQRRPAHSGWPHRTALACCIYFLALNSGELVWAVYGGFRYGTIRSRQMYAQVGASAVQVLAWSVMTGVTHRATKAARKYYPRLLRGWWIVCSAVALLALVVDVFTLVVNGTHFELGFCVDLVSAPAALLLCVVAALGETGVQSLEDGSLHEPLLGASEEEEGVQVTPFSQAGIFSLTTISWLNPVLAVGARKPLEAEDLPLLAPEHRAKTNCRLLQGTWNDLKLEAPESRPSLVKAIWRCYWKIAVRNGVFAGANACAAFVGPYLISDFVDFLGGKQNYSHEGYVLAFLFVGAKLMESLTQRQWNLGTEVLGLRVRSALTGMVYWKGLRLSSESRHSHTTGEIINYMAVDVTRIGDFAYYLHDTWILPLQIALALAILYKSVGIATLATFAATIFTLTGTTPIGRLIERFQGRVMKAKDARMKATAEALRSMSKLKLNAWENRYLAKLEQLRKEESGWLAKSLYTTCVNTFVFWASPIFVSVFTFATCVFLGIPLTAGRVLSALATFRVLQEPMRNFPDLVSMLAQTKVSLNRIWYFLQEDELRSDVVMKLPMESKEGEASESAVEVIGGTFSWDPSLGTPTLRNLNAKVKVGERVAVCGPVGSGKSSLLSCLLGEMPKLSGTVKVRGRTAYVSQTAWIQSGSVQDNILFGNAMDRDKYDRVLKVCQLKKDLELFAYGDKTEIGERGINLSGGQKQRIQMARAVYQDADIYILDDPFSALDAQTTSQIFKECILQELCSKTVVFVTHQVDFLPVADLILVLRNGEIVECGNYNQLLQAGTDFTVLVGAHNEAVDAMDAMECLTKDDEEEDDVFVDELICVAATGDNDDEIESPRCRSPKCMIDEVLMVKPSFGETKVEKKKRKKNKKKQGKVKKLQLVQEEERARGHVSWQTYKAYLTAVYGGALVPLILLAMLMFQGLQIAGNWWMAWATPTTEEEQPMTSNFTMLAVYSALAFGSALFVFIRAGLVTTVGLLTANKLFYAMNRSIFRAPMSFFDSTPTGRILNRASTDQSSLDLELHSRFRAFGSITIQLLGIILVMAQVSWVVICFFTPVIVLCILIQRYYVSSARELARLVGIQKSPTIHHYGESIAGAVSIRGFGQEQRFMATNLKLLDAYAQPLFHNFAAIEWLIFRMELLSVLVFAIMLLLVVTFPASVDASMAGLAVTYGLQLNSRLSKWVWELCNLENKIIVVERIQQYSNLPSEAPLIVENCRPPKDWPQEGRVDLVNLQVRYVPQAPLVLHGITCTFPGSSRVGIVGRTGCGKSTLIQALFRVVEPAGGEIHIDGLNISTIGLHDLRTKLSIIPQDPLLFEGTVRGNLDPLEDYSDPEIWEALDKCQLGAIVRAKSEKLNTPVTENGENWSVGQRQLLCLGRALLKRTRILVMDEATASVDSSTDNVMQRIIREEFAGCTVITVAHRIPTVIDSSLVLVLSEGRVAEFDTPAKLLENKSSMLWLLVNEYSSRSADLCGLAASGRLGTLRT